MKEACSAEGCARPSKLKSLCARHYLRLWRSGAIAPRANAIDRFWGKVNKCGPIVRVGLGRCWLWMGGTFANGYGVFTLDGETLKAHRVAFLFANGYLPAIGRHRCDVKLCCRPSHVLDGTILDNVKDREVRHRTARGERSGTAKLTEIHVAEILQDSRNQREIAKDYGVCKSTVGYIKRRESWKEVSL